MHQLDGLGYRDATVVVTGGASGMGEAVARILATWAPRSTSSTSSRPACPTRVSTSATFRTSPQVRATAAALADIAPIDFVFPCAGLPPAHQGAALLHAGQLHRHAAVRRRDCCRGQGRRRHRADFLRRGDGLAGTWRSASRCWRSPIPTQAYAWCEADPDTRVRDGYTTSKEMLVVWVQNAAVELGLSRRIRLNAIGPCPTRTAFMDSRRKSCMPEGFIDAWPYPSLGRMATAEDQAWPLILLNSPLNAAITGTFVYTDQGFASGVFTGAIKPMF
jgi:NAD(P)-dependent dehydrogenase (short-subunit alcohol dehydrogenase family)